jgi:hypothetical protein
MLVTWRAAARALRPRLLQRRPQLQRAFAWVVAIQLVAWLSWLAVPVLRTGAFPRAIEHAPGRVGAVAQR